jgi:hypothetical protein
MAVTGSPTVKAGPIPSAWVRWLARQDAGFLLAVKGEAEAQGVEDDDEEGIKRVGQDVMFARSVSPGTMEYRRKAKDRRTFMNKMRRAGAIS